VADLKFGHYMGMARDWCATWGEPKSTDRSVRATRLRVRSGLAGLQLGAYSRGGCGRSEVRPLHGHGEGLVRHCWELKSTDRSVCGLMTSFTDRFQDILYTWRWRG
jgi:hypothetical protein